MSRIYAGSAHTVADMPESLYEELKFLLSARPAAFALLEFTSPGNQHRQVDCAVVSPGGVDLIEIKHKANPVRGTADGAWATDDGGQLNTFSNRKAGRTENPYQQASSTADDLAWGLATRLRLRRERVRVYPMVLIPEAHPDCEIAAHSRVHLALGSDALSERLRAFNWNSVWTVEEYGALPDLLGLTPIELGSVTGRVVDADTRQSLRSVKLNVASREEALATDFRGGFHFMAPLGAELALVLEPGPLHLVTTVQVHVDHRHIELGHVPVCPVVTEAARQAALEQVNAEYQQRFLSLQAASSDQVEQLTAANQTLLEGLQREHDERRALERRLAATLERIPSPDLVTQVQRRHELARLQEERERARSLLLALRRPEVQASDDLRREAAEHLVVMRAARLPALPPSAPAPSPDAPSRFRVTGRSPAPHVAASAGPEPGTRVSPPPSAATPPRRWPMVALGALLLTGVVAGIWHSQRLAQTGVDAPTGPAVTVAAPPAVEAEPKQGAGETAPSGSAGDLPDEVVTEAEPGPERPVRVEGARAVRDAQDRSPANEVVRVVVATPSPPEATPAPRSPEAQTTAGPPVKAAAPAALASPPVTAPQPAQLPTSTRPRTGASAQGNSVKPSPSAAVAGDDLPGEVVTEAAPARPAQAPPQEATWTPATAGEGDDLPGEVVTEMAPAQPRSAPDEALPGEPVGP